MSRYHGPGDRSGGTTARQKTRALKRAEAQARNLLTPDWQRKANRRDPVNAAMATLRRRQVVLTP